MTPALKSLLPSSTLSELTVLLCELLCPWLCYFYWYTIYMSKPKLIMMCLEQDVLRKGVLDEMTETVQWGDFTSLNLSNKE